jgi:hypothetical protein
MSPSHPSLSWKLLLIDISGAGSLADRTQWCREIFSTIVSRRYPGARSKVGGKCGACGATGGVSLGRRLGSKATPNIERETPKSRGAVDDRGACLDVPGVVGDLRGPFAPIMDRRRLNFRTRL